MRTFLRQDPDIIMVGEIRDPDTAQMAIRASLTGHLVLSTIHTKPAWGAIPRLINMGLPPYLVADTINVSVAQRLVKRLCPCCKAERAFREEDFPFAIDTTKRPSRVFNAVGCVKCNFKGYRGRTAHFEVVTIGRSLSNIIRMQEYDVSSKLTEMGVESLADQAIKLVTSGTTSPKSVFSLLLDNEAY